MTTLLTRFFSVTKRGVVASSCEKEGKVERGDKMEGIRLRKTEKERGETVQSGKILGLVLNVLNVLYMYV